MSLLAAFVLFLLSVVLCFSLVFSWREALRVPAAAGVPLVRTGVFVGVVCLCTFGLAWWAGAFHSNSLVWSTSLAQRPEFNQSANPALPVSATAHPGDNSTLTDRIAALKSRLDANGDDLQGWVLLSRSLANQGDYPGSADALVQALRLDPNHPDLMADLADMLAMAAGRQLQGEPMKWVQATLEINPQHEKALALAASAAEQQADPEQAARYWQRLAAAQAAALVPATQPVLAQVLVDIAPAALTQLPPHAVLFVTLKAQPGPGMPLAAVRIPAMQLQAGLQRVQFMAVDLIQNAAIGELPDVVHAQARLSVAGTAESSSADVQSAWLQLSAGQESPDAILRLQP